MGLRRTGTVLALLALGGTLVAAAPVQAAGSATVAWHVDPGTARGAPGAVNVGGDRGRLTITGGGSALAYPAPTDLRQAVSRVDGMVIADRPSGSSVEVAVRGRYRAGWGEWRTLPAEFAEPVQQVQVRLLLVAGSAGAPVVRDVMLVGTAGGQQSVQLRSAPPVAEYRVYATREGLVGRATANGHMITPSDHFVSLPSWAALSPKGTGDYSVRACVAGRCAYEPVWDVGPWNTHDDFWASPRSQWTNLPTGVPEAQAAFQTGYNGGHDQYGRTVLNPAGIDLADGTVWDDLHLTNDNRWVTVRFLWTGSGTQGQVQTQGTPLNVRSGPGTGYANVGLAGRYARVPIECQVNGETITGVTGTTSVWYRIGPGNYVSRGYVAADSGVNPPRC